jgi:hypothetical protein
MAQKRPPTKRPEAERPAGKTGPISEQLGPRLRAELEQIEKSEAKILRGLSSKRTAEEFLRDPAAALRRMKVDVPPIMAARLKEPSPLIGLVAPRRYQLPNGQVVTARVTVRFTAGEPGRRGGQEA